MPSDCPSPRRTLLALLGSPRKDGNCELFAKEVFRSFPAGWRLRLIRLPECDIRPCRACYRCLSSPCPQADDFAGVLAAIAASDAFLVATPAYMLSANGSLKRFLDRGLGFYREMEHLWGKPAAAAAIAGVPGLEGGTKLECERFARLLFADLRGSEVVTAALPGEAVMSEAGRAAAWRLSRALLSGAPEPDPDIPACPACGCDSFRFLPGGRARCLLCGTEGDAAWDGGGFRVLAVPRPDHPFLTREGARQHAAWLSGMIARYAATRRALRAAARPYAAIGEWALGGGQPPEGP